MRCRPVPESVDHTNLAGLLTDFAKTNDFTDAELVASPIFRRFDNGLLHQTSLISIPQTELNKVLGDGIPATSFAAGRNETSGVSGNYNYQNEDGTPNGWPRTTGDWLPPEGKGERADLEIRTKLTIDEVLQVGKYKDWKKTFFTFSNTVRFPGEGNGCRAEMTSPTAGIKLRNAPEAGYGKTIVNRFGVKRKIVGPNVNEAEYSDSNPNRCYYFRIRSRFDDKGNLVEAYYGKVYGDFNFHGRWDLGFRGVDFLYYLNPKSLDRNLEWDIKTNLCPTAGKHESQQP